MAKKRKLNNPDLRNKTLFFNDTSNTSPDVFRITDFPLRFTAGKNLIKLQGNSANLKPGSILQIQITDSNNDPIYNEILNYLEDDGSRVIAVYIYPDTPEGDCIVTLGTELTELNGRVVPAQFQNKINTIWSETIPVSPTAVNESEVIFTSEPVITLDEQIAVQLDRSFSGSLQTTTYDIGTVQYINRNDDSNILLTGGKFNSDMKDGTLTVTNPINPLPVPNFSLNTTPIYTSKIKKVLNDTTLTLESPFIFLTSQSLSQQKYTQFDNSTYSIEYNVTPTFNATQNSQSFALMQIKNLSPDTGDISRIKLYGSNNGSIGDYELLNDIDLTPTEIFVDATGSILPDVSIGFFTSQSIINEYWESKTFLNNIETTGPTMTWSTSSLNNAMLISSATDISKYNDVHIIKSKDSIQGVFVENSQYKIQFDAIGTQLIPGQDSKISIYLSGSSFNFDGSDILNQELPINLGKKIGEVKTTATNQRYDDVNFTFMADKDGLGSILFVIENGQWQLSDVQTLSDSDFGFTENYTRLRTLIPVEHKSDNQISFKLEYYNTAGNKSKTISYVNNKTFEGGNRYIDGAFSLLTGSLFVADSLDSGIDISGLQGTGFIRSLPYAGFNQATGSGPAGFLIYSGSALPNQTETSYGGVGLELVADENNFFRFRTSGSNGQGELDIRTEKIVMSGSEVSINTPTFFLGEAATQFISGANGQLEISSSGYHIQPSGDITASKILIEGGTITDDVTILGSVSANSILTPATIGGSPSTAANASSSISDQGLAIFKSASIGGFVVSSEEIRSADQELRLKAGGQITASRILLEGGTITDGVTILGSVTANSIQTPALIDGNPSTANNASSSISDQGLAIFKSASIGGWDITTASIQGGNLIMKPQGILQTRDFASGFKGWKISSEGNGTAEFENVRIRGTLRTTTFEKESVNAVGGQLWVTNATTISGSNITANDTTMSVANASGFTLGEILLAKKVDGTGFQTEYLLIESASIDGDDSNADETYGRLYVQRGYGSGSQGSFVGDLASTSQSYDEGQVLVSTGLSGSGYIKMNANPRDTATPFIDIVERTGSGLFDVGLKVRLGDLSGLANSDYVFGNPSPGFGLATDNVFLQGGIIANTGSIGGIELESSKLYIGAGTHANSNTGFYVDSGSNFSLGDKLTWDGSSLTVRGQLRLESGENVQDAINEATASNTAKSLILTVDSQVMSFVSASSNDAIPSNIIFSIAQQNLTASISSSNVTITTAQGTGVTGFNFDTGSVTSNSAGLYSGVVSGSLTFANAIDAGGLANTKANFPVTIETSGDGLTDTVSIFKLEGGSSGSDGTSGTDGVDAVTAFLTNESHTFPADVNGNISSFAGGTTNMKVFQGITDVTTNYTYTGSNTTGVTATSSSNAITVTGLTVDSGSITFTAVSASTSLSKILSLAKSKQGSQGDPGSTAKLITLTTDSQVFSFPSASSSDAIDDDILFIINQQNLDSAVVTGNITIKDSGGSTLTNPSLITNVTSGTGQVSGSITFSGTVGGDKTKLPLSIEVSRDSVSDTTRIFKLEGGATGSDGSDGAAGADGTDAITAFLTNESHTFPATADGTVPDFSTGTTDMVVFLGLTNVTSSFTFTGSNSSGVTATSSSNSLTVTGMTHDSGSINFTAISASVSLTKTMNLAKSKTGETGSTAKSLILTSDSQVFSFPSASSSTATDDDILIIINQQNLSGAIGASDLTIKDSSGTTLSDPTLVANVTNGSGQVSGSITFSSTVSGNKTKLPLTIDVAKDGLSDSTRIFKIEGGSSGSDGSDGAAGSDGAPAVTGFLTNESHTFPADVNGTISSFNEGSSSMFVFVGLTNSTSSFSYSRTNSTGITSTLGGDAGNVLAISAMSHDSGTIDITATSASVSILKTMTLAKSKQGAAGAGGATGATGPNFDFLSGSIGEINTTGGLNAGLIMTSDVLGFHGAIAEGDGTNATISDFISFLDSDGNFFIGSSSAGHFAYSQNTGRLLISGSNVDIQTPKFFLGKDDVQFISGSNGLLEISSSGYHIQPTGDITASKFLLKGGRITSDVTIEGSVSANSILVPADLSAANASASISDQGLAIFRSASIAGFNVNEEEIKSANSKLRLKASGQVTASTLQLINGTFVGQAQGSLSGSALQMNAPTFLFGGTSQFVSGSNGNIEISSSNFHLTPEGNVTMSGTITAAAGEIGGFTIGDDLDSTAGTLKLKGASGQITASDVLFDGGTIGGFELDSISIASTDNSLVMSASGQITGSNVLFSGGEIGGFTLSADELKSSNNNLRLKDSGQITGSDVLFDGGTIGGFTITSDKIKSGTNIRLDAGNKKFIINDNTFGNTGIQLEYNSGTPRAHIGTENAERITFDGSNLIMSASTFVLGSPTQFVSGANGNIEISSSNFHLDNTGNVNMSGTITSTAGNIGGFTIDSVGIKSTNQDGLSLITPKLILSSSGQITGSNVLFDGGKIAGFDINTIGISSADKSLILSASGQITGSNVLFDGGTIGGFTINADHIFDAGKNFELTGSTGNIKAKKGTIGGFHLTADTITGSNIVIDSAGSIQTADYASDLKGWKISAQDNGFAEFENAKIRGTLSTAVFEKETVNAVGGQLYVANSTTLTSSVSHSSANYLPTDNTMSVVNVTGFSIGEILSAKKVSSTGFGTEYIYVESASRNDSSSDDDFSGNIFVLRGYSGSLPADSGFGSASLGDSPGAAQSYSGSQVLVSTGKVGSGFIRLNANPNNQATPYIDIVERTGSAIYDVALKARLGDLSGLAGSSIVFGNQSPGFGLATDNVYLQGGITATFGQIGGFAITSTAISSSNDSLILRGDNGQITGSKVLLDGGEIAGFDINTIGISSADKSLILSASGQITASDANITGDIVANTITANTAGTIANFNINSVGIKSSNSNLILSASGNITASNAKITGDIVANTITANTAGTIAGFNINSVGIKSSNSNLILSASGQITGSNVLFSGGRIANFNIIGNTLLGKDGATERIRLDALSGDLQLDGEDVFGITLGGVSSELATSTLPFFAATKEDGSRTIFKVGDANQFIKFDTGGSPKLFISSSTYFLGSSNQFISGANGNIEISSSNFHLDNSGNVNMSGTITSTAGNIGGFEINSVGIKSSNNNLILSSSGQITGSDVLFDGGTIGGFSLGSNKLQSGLFSLNAQDGAGTIILAGTNTFGADGIHMAFNANAGGGSANTKFFVGNNNGSKIQYLNDILTISSSAFVLGSPQQFVSGANGNIEISSSNFHLANNGDVSMTGTITATAGDIGGFNITSDAIASTDGNLVLSGSGRVTASAGIIGGFELSANKFEGTPEIISVVSQSVTNTAVSCSFLEMQSAPTTGVLNVSIDYFSTPQETNDATGDKNGGLVDVDFWNGLAQAGNLYVYASTAGEISSPVNLFNEIDTEGNPFAAVSVAKVGNFGTPSVKFFSLDGFQVGTASFGGDLHFINEDEYGGAGTVTFVSGANQTTTFNSEKQSILLNSSEKSLSIATGSFGDTGIQLQYNDGNPKFFVGTDTGSHFKYDSNIVSISSSNFTVTPAGEVEAKQIELTDYAKADYFVFKLLKINVANSGSFFEQYTVGGKNYTKLVLDGSIGGSIAQSVRIECVPNNPIGMIQPPVKSNSQGHEVTIECATTAVGYAALVAVSGSNSYAYGFYGDSDDWFYQLFQTRVYPAGGSVTYGGGSVGDIGASSGRIMVQNSGQRFRFVRSAYDFRLLGVSSYDTTAAGNFNSQGLVNFHSGLKTTSGPIAIGKGATEKATAGYAFEVDAITDRNGTTTDDSYFHGNITVAGTIKDSSGDAGSSGQILSSTGTGTNWIANSGGGGSGDIEGVTAGSGLTGGGTSGTVTLNVGAGTGIDVATDAISVDVSDFMTNGSNNRVVTATGADAMNAEANMTFDGTNLLVSDDSNSYANIGRTRIGYATYSDYAYFSHRDNVSAGQYALIQASGGDTFLNAVSGQEINFRINNSDKMIMTATGLNVSSGHITASGNISSSATVTANKFKLNESGTTTLTEEVSNGTVEVNTGNGYVRIGPANSGFAHFITDRTQYYFNKKIVVDEGIIGSYDEDLSLRRVYSSANDSILIRATSIGFFLDGAEDMRLENDGDLHAEGDVIASSTTISDIRLKDNIIQIGGALDKIKSLRGVSYTWNAGKKKGKQDIGLIAQEVEEIIPEVVKDKKMPLMDGIDPDETYKTIDYEKIIAVLIEAVKDQQTQIDELKRKIK